MAKVIKSIEKVAVTGTAKDVDVNYRSFYIQNLTADQTVYFKEKSIDDKACTANNGFAIGGGKTIEPLLRAKTLSIIGSGSADVRIMYVNEEI